MKACMGELEMRGRGEETNHLSQKQKNGIKEMGEKNRR